MKINKQIIEQLETQTLQKMRQINNYIVSQLQKAVQYEKEHHLYQNRTGNLEKSTQVKIIKETPDLFEADIEIAMEYAPYVYDKGLMVIDLAVEMAEQNIDQYMRSLV